MPGEHKLWVVCAFRNRADLLEASLASIAAQTCPHLGGVLVGDDASDDPDVGRVLDRYEGRRDWTIVRRPKRISVVGNQTELIGSQAMSPADVLVFLDGDDRFAHPEVLDVVHNAYDDPDIDLTYGSYEPDPFHPGCKPCRDIPVEVCAERGAYRRWARANGVAWNHLRTFRRRIYDAIPAHYTRRRNGRWLEGGADFAMMTPALELAGGRHRFITETLVLYTSDREDAEWRTQTPGIRSTHRYIKGLPPLRALPPMDR